MRPPFFANFHQDNISNSMAQEEQQIQVYYVKPQIIAESSNMPNLENMTNEQSMLQFHKFNFQIMHIFMQVHPRDLLLKIHSGKNLKKNHKVMHLLQLMMNPKLIKNVNKF